MSDPLAAAAIDDVRRVNLRRLLNPRSIAVVGASVDPAKAGSQALRSLSGFPGSLVAIHPREAEVQGVRAYPTFAALPEPVDLGEAHARHLAAKVRNAPQRFAR
jgi:acetyltransferase